MYFNEQRFATFVSQKSTTRFILADGGLDANLANPIEDSQLLTLTQKHYLYFQLFLKSEKLTKEMEQQGVFKATPEELKEFKTINHPNLEDKALRLQAFFTCNDKFLGEITKELLANKDDKLARYKFNSRERAGDVHAKFNLILVKYYFKDLKTELILAKLDKLAKTAFKSTHTSQREEMADKARHAQHKQRLINKMLEARKYIATNQPGSEQLPPFFDTSIGEKYRSKLALSSFGILGLSTLTAAIGIGLAFGGFIALPAFLAWIAPIAFTLLISLSVISGLSLTALLAESFNPKAIKHFFKITARSLRHVTRGLISFFQWNGNLRAHRFQVQPFYELKINTIEQKSDFYAIGFQAYKEKLKASTGKTLLQTLLYPFAWLLGSGMVILVSPVYGIVGSYIFAKEKGANTAVKILAAMAALLTFPLSFFVVAGIDSAKDNEKASTVERQRLFDDAWQKYTDTVNAETLIQHAKAIQPGKPIQLGKRFDKLLTALATPQPKANVEALLDKARLTTEKGMQQRTRFIQTAYKGFERGIFRKPAAWPDNINNFQEKTAQPTVSSTQQ